MTWTVLPPPSVVASWPVPNLEHPQTRGPEQYIVTGVFGGLASFAVLLRLYTRIFTRRYFGVDDGLILAAYLSAIAVMVLGCVGSGHDKWDRHIWDWPISLMPDSLLNLYLARIFWGIATSLVRLSILCLFYRLLARLEAPRSFQWVLHVVTIFSVAFLFSLFFTAVIPCFPVQAYWQFLRFQTQGENFVCINDFRSMQFAAIFNTVTEVVLAILPVIAVFKLEVDPKQRWTIISLLSLGFFVAVAGTARSYFLWKIVNTWDLTWWAGPHWICAEVEIDLGLTFACAAPLRPVIGRVAGRLKGSFPTLTKSARKAASSELRDKEQFNMSNTLCSQDTSFKGDPGPVITNEDRREWLQATSRTIDLEGIAEDGFGYCVTITGPTSKGLAQRGRLRKWNLLRSTRIDNIASSGASVTGSAVELNGHKSTAQVRSLSIAMNTVTEVAASRRSPVCWEGPSQKERGSNKHFSDELRSWEDLDPPQAYG